MTTKVVKYTPGLELQETANALGAALVLSAFTTGFGLQEGLFTDDKEASLTNTKAGVRTVRVTFEWADEQ